MNNATDTVKVWDPLVRFGHWALAIAFATAWLSGDESSRTHVWAGYAIAGLVGLRILWGMVGSRNARFTQFVRSPGAALRYVASLFRGRPRRYLGHNPAGGLMVVALLTCLVVTGVSGMAVYAIEEGAGPLAAWFEQGRTAATYGHDDDDDDRGRGHRDNEALEEVWEEVHEIAANLTLLLVTLHIAGVVASSIAHRENLARAMITGRKRAADPGDG